MSTGADNPLPAGLRPRRRRLSSELGVIWAVARHTIAEGIRMKVALVFIILIIVMLPFLMITTRGDGTLPGKVQNFLAWSLGTVNLFLGLLTIFLACGSLAGEIRDRQIHTVVTKPVRRWQILLGKWLGIGLLDLVMLMVAGLAAYGSVSYTHLTLPTN